MMARFEKDFQEASTYFPKLQFSKIETGWVIYGTIDICDKAGVFWESFEIELKFSNAYPFDVPKLREVSSLIVRMDDNHISTTGDCCLDIQHELMIASRQGISVLKVLKSYVYPYFANQIYKSQEGKYAGKEYRHNFEGIIQYYSENLNINSNELAIRVLEKILAKEIPGRNDPCICGRTKFKCCHLDSVDKLKSLPIDRLKSDLEGFKKLLNERMDNEFVQEK